MNQVDLQPIELKAPEGMTEAQAIGAAYVATLKALEEAVKAGNYARVSALGYALSGLAASLAK